MIGEPTNFVHTTHVGSGDMGLGLASVSVGRLFRTCNYQSITNVCVRSADIRNYVLVGGPCPGADEI